MLTFTVTLCGPSEHAERNTAQRLWAALENAQESYRDAAAMLIGKAEYTEPKQKGKI